MARNQQSRGQDLLRGALNLASSYVNKRTELPRAIIPPAVGIGAGVGDFVFDPTRPTIGESTQSGLGTGKAAAELMKYAKFPQLSAPTQAPVGEGTVLLGEGQSPYQPQAPQAQTPVANGQPSSIPLLPPVVTTEQTEMGPVTLEVPVVSPEGAAFMEGVTLPPAGSGTVLQTPQQAGAGTVMQQPLSEQFSQAGVQQGSFIPQQLGAQPAAPTSPQANFESRMATGIPLTDAEIQSASQFGASRGLSFSPETGYTQAPTPAGPTFQGQPLSEYLAGGIQLDPQGRMIDPDVDRSAFEQASEARSMAAGNSIRPGVDVPSLAMQRARMDAGLDPVAGAPMGTEMSQQQQRDMLDRGFDPATGKKIGGDMTTKEALEQEGLRLKNAKTLAEINKIMQPSQAELSDFEKEVDKKVAPQYLDWKQGGEARSQANIDKLSGVAKDLAEGQIDTRNISSLLPVGSEYMNTIFNPDLTDAMNRIRGVAFQSLRQTLGAQFTEREGKNLVETYFNPALNEQQNLSRLNTFISTLTKAHEAQRAMFNYLESNNTLSGYSMDSSPRAIMEGLLETQGASGSPIQGDVDVATAADEILAGK